jgi:hypothetical protein
VPSSSSASRSSQAPLSIAMPELAHRRSPGLRRPEPFRHPGAADGEPVGPHLVAQPLSAAASAAYLGAGWVIWKGRHLDDDPVGAACFAAAVAANGLGGVAFHGPGDPLSRWVHDTALCATLAAQAARRPGAAIRPGILTAVAGGA